jgi:hypothetical protein
MVTLYSNSKKIPENRPLPLTMGHIEAQRPKLNLFSHISVLILISKKAFKRKTEEEI